MDGLGIPHFGAFVAAGLLLNLTPGPDLLYACTRGAAQGRRAAWAAAFGTATGGLIQVALALLGVSALLAASPAAFGLLRVAGAVWLVWLGFRMLAARGSADPSLGGAGPAGAQARPLPAIWREAIAIAVLNPKTTLFFLAFVPQFIAADAAHPALAFALLGGVFVLNGTLVTGTLAALAATAAGSLRTAPANTRWRRGVDALARLLPRALGALFVALGVRLALSSH